MGHPTTQECPHNKVVFFPSFLPLTGAPAMLICTQQQPCLRQSKKGDRKECLCSVLVLFCFFLFFQWPPKPLLPLPPSWHHLAARGLWSSFAPSCGPYFPKTATGPPSLSTLQCHKHFIAFPAVVGRNCYSIELQHRRHRKAILL